MSIINYNEIEEEFIMGKCIRCGKEAFLFKNFELQDGEICKKCFRALGFDKSYDMITSVYSYEEIKDGLDEYYRKKNEKAKQKKSPSRPKLTPEQVDFIMDHIDLSVKMTGGEKPLDANEEEQQIFEVLCSMYKIYGKDPEELNLVRFSDNYLSVKLNESDLARFRYGKRTKWIMFPCIEKVDERHAIETPEDVLQYDKQFEKSLVTIDSF